MSLTYDTLSPSLGVRNDAFGNPVGKAVPNWHGCHKLPDATLVGRTCSVVPYDHVFAEGLFEEYSKDDGRMFGYLPYGPFGSIDELHDVIETWQKNRGLHTFVIVKDEHPIGHASFMRYDLQHGSVEVGGVTFSPALQRSVMATEAMYLMMKHAFDHGYRRYEWKCNQLNMPSNLAALRLGFSFEGVFRNAQVSHESRRDTAWYSVIVEEWPAVKARLEAWLDPSNFDADGTQKTALRDVPLTV